MIYCLIGIPGSGKTTLAQTMVRYTNTIVVGRDPLREKLFGYKPDNLQRYYDDPDREQHEKVVTSIHDAIIKQALALGKHIIADSTHLKLKDINALKKFNVPIKFIPVEIELEEAIHRDSLRPSPIGRTVITEFYQRLEHLKKNFDFKDWTPPVIEPIAAFNDKLMSAYVFDLDGTLALNESGRSPYHWSRVGEDSLNMPVKIVLDALDLHGYSIILCSGRDAVCRPETIAWLDKHEISYDGLFMRTQGDNRKDAVVKEELWRDIANNYNIVAMFDDRQQVVDHGRALGFPVFQVAPGKF